MSLLTKTSNSNRRLARYDRLVRTLSRNCPLGDKPSPLKAARWRRAYNTLFKVAAMKGAQ